MGTAIFLIILLIIWLLFGVRIQAWIGRKLREFAARRTEDFIRRAAGMPPRPGSREERRQNRENARQSSARRQSSSRNAGAYYREQHPYPGSILPKEYAEDVEFIEYKEYSEDNIDIRLNDSPGYEEYHESQVSDAEWVEVKTDRNSRSSR